MYRIAGIKFELVLNQKRVADVDLTRFLAIYDVPHVLRLQLYVRHYKTRAQSSRTALKMADVFWQKKPK
jgi:hypothetical protein